MLASKQRRPISPFTDVITGSIVFPLIIIGIFLGIDIWLQSPMPTPFWESYWTPLKKVCMRKTPSSYFGRTTAGSWVKRSTGANSPCGKMLSRP